MAKWELRSDDALGGVGHSARFARTLAHRHRKGGAAAKRHPLTMNGLVVRATAQT
jgi:hypothetical protein